MSHYFIVIAWSLAAVAAKSKDRRPLRKKKNVRMKAATQHIMVIVSGLFLLLLMIASKQVIL